MKINKKKSINPLHYIMYLRIRFLTVLNIIVELLYIKTNNANTISLNNIIRNLGWEKCCMVLIAFEKLKVLWEDSLSYIITYDGLFKKGKVWRRT